MTEPQHLQDNVSVKKNKLFFAKNEAYAARVGGLATYQNIRNVIDRGIRGHARVIDIGNGGVFDYDTSLVDQVVGVDLFLGDVDLDVPPNVVLQEGDALDLKQEDASFDCGLCVFLLHHLVGEDVTATVENISRSIREARRVIAPGGKLVVVESCVSQRAFAVERKLYPALRRLAGTRVMKHPPTLQLTPDLIARLLAAEFTIVDVQRIPVGAFVLQFGHRWPSVMTPARPYVFSAA